MSRTTVAAEIGRLEELGADHQVGPAPSRGGRRPPLVDLAPDMRFVGIAIGSTSVAWRSPMGGWRSLAQISAPDCDIKAGPHTVLALVRPWWPQAAGAEQP